MLLTALLSYVAGLLTVLAPCILPLLPVILGGSLDATDKDRKRPYIITASLVGSLIFFTIVLKASTALLGVDPRVWSIGAGLLVITLGIFMLFPDLWAKVIGRLGIEHRSQSLLGRAFNNKNKNVSAILTGVALGPVFSSCSPTYAWVLATVLPANTALGIFYLAIYCLGVATSLLAIALLGRRLLEKISWASDPKGWFQRGIAVLFILVGICVATGWDKKVQTYFVERDVFNLIELEQKLVPEDDNNTKGSTNNSEKQRFNVDPYDAPALTGLNSWINSQPLTLEEQKGKVVLVDFWTYSCINCQRTQPFLNAWHDKYSDDGLVIIGAHAPEFAFERLPQNVERATKTANIKYPVALDNDFATWNAYNNRFWPAKYLIDKDGQVRYTHFGEGEYETTERTIQALLKETGQSISSQTEKETTNTTSSGQTAETYLSSSRGDRFENSSQYKSNTPVDYQLIARPKEHHWSLGGRWQISAESSQSLDTGSSLRLSASAREVYLVMSGPPNARISITSSISGNWRGQDVAPDGTLTIDTARLYKIVKLDQFERNQQITLQFPAGVTVNAFTFGS